LNNLKAPPVKHVTEYLGNVPQAHDNNSLWRNFNSNNFEKVNYTGVHGNQWTPPQGNTQNTGEFDKVASPQPPAAISQVTGDRIIAHELPANTQSPSSFDIPQRKDVLQIDVPNSRTTTTTFSYNAATSSGPNPDVKLHGINTVPQKILHGSFLELDDEKKKEDKKAVKAKKPVEKKTDSKPKVTVPTKQNKKLLSQEDKEKIKEADKKQKKEAAIKEEKVAIKSVTSQANKSTKEVDNLTKVAVKQTNSNKMQTAKKYSNGNFQKSPSSCKKSFR